jgi:transketolase
MTVVAPADPVEMALATAAILEHDGPVYLRTGRSVAPRVFDEAHRFQLGRGSVVRDGDDVTIVACGVEVGRALGAADLLAAEGITARVVNLATIKPIDEELVARCAAETGCVVTAEDHNVIGGLGGAVAETLGRTCPVPLEIVGVCDVFGASGEPDELAEAFGLTAPHIAAAAKRALDRRERRWS